MVQLLQVSDIVKITMSNMFKNIEKNVDKQIKNGTFQQRFGIHKTESNEKTN